LAEFLVSRAYFIAFSQDESFEPFEFRNYVCNFVSYIIVCAKRIDLKYKKVGYTLDIQLGCGSL
jgi:hypothetical protein